MSFAKCLIRYNCQSASKSFKGGEDSYCPCVKYCGNFYLAGVNPLPNKMSAKFIVCFNFQSASMSLKVGENVV